MDLKKLFELFEKEEERRFQMELEGPEPFGANKGKNRYKKAYESFQKMYENHEFGKTTSSGENLDAMKKYSLSIEEASIIYMYTSHGIHAEVNLRLRENHAKYDKDIKEYKNLLNQSLDKMPSFNNSTVYRDISHPGNVEEIMDYYYYSNLRKKIVENAFISSHIEKSRWSDINSGIHLIITTSNKSNGKDLR